MACTTYPASTAFLPMLPCPSFLGQVTQRPHNPSPRFFFFLSCFLSSASSFFSLFSLFIYPPFLSQPSCGYEAAAIAGWHLVHVKALQLQA